MGPQRHCSFQGHEVVLGTQSQGKERERSPKTLDALCNPQGLLPCLQGNRKDRAVWSAGELAWAQALTWKVRAKRDPKDLLQ